MKYKAEIHHEGKVYSKNFNATHPKQVVRKITNSNCPDTCTLYVLNESGEVWIYSINKPLARLRQNVTLNKDNVDDILSNNLTIRGAI